MSTTTTENARKPATIPFAERLTCTVEEARAATSLGRTTLYALMGEGRLQSTVVGRRRLILVKSLLSILTTTG